MYGGEDQLFAEITDEAAWGIGRGLIDKLKAKAKELAASKLAGLKDLAM
jgi:hypothetical protein